MTGCIELPKLMYPVPDCMTGERHWGRTGTRDVAAGEATGTGNGTGAGVNGTGAGVAVCGVAATGDGVAATGEATGDAACGVAGICWSNGVTGVVAVAVVIAATGGGNGRDGVLIPANLKAIASATISSAAGGTVMT